MKTKLALNLFAGVFLLLSTTAAGVFSPQPQADDPNPPDQVVKLVFIHHSTGENWLRDDYGGLGLALSQNNYFVSDTNYGWGPDAIGDRTDIPNWTEWFASEGTPRYMQALFGESGQNADYTRTLADPGGENEVVVFKSCFPNSALEGNPNDSPDPEGWLSVGHAKYVYNEILQYFRTRPDKLFVVITAPPLSDGTYAENARAFNDWLLNDWLRENNYALDNVAVFDFYNMLTSPDAHHRVNRGQVEYIDARRNTLYYPSEDDHPSAEGSRKATAEFLPLLNVYYHRWVEGLPAQAQPPAAQANPASTQPAAAPTGAPLSGSAGLLDDFEGGILSGTAGWESYFQDDTDTKLTCARDGTTVLHGSGSLKFAFDVQENSWATCGYYFDSVQNWQAGQGVSFSMRADQAGLPFDIDLYGGSPGGRTTFIYRTRSSPDSVNGWVPVEVRWDQFLGAEWESNAGTPFDPSAVTGFSFGLSAPESSRVAGTLWIDDLQLIGAPQTAARESVTEPAAEQPAERRGGGLPCIGSLILPLLFAGAVVLSGRRILPG